MAVPVLVIAFGAVLVYMTTGDRPGRTGGVDGYNRRRLRNLATTEPRRRRVVRIGRIVLLVFGVLAVFVGLFELIAPIH